MLFNLLPLSTVWLKLEATSLNDLLKIAVEEPESKSNSDTMAEIDNYQDSSAQSSDDVESSDEKSDSEDEEGSRDNHTGDEIYETFPHLGKYANKSLDPPLSIPHLLKWHTTKDDNIINLDPFKYREKPTKIVGNVDYEHLSDQNPNKPCENSILIGQNIPTTDLAVDDEDFSTQTADEILPLPIVDNDLVAVDEYFTEEVDEVVEEMKEYEMKEEEKEQEEEKMAEKEKEKLEEYDEQKEEEKLEAKKEEDSDEEMLEEKKKQENKKEHIASGEEEKEQQEEKMTGNEEEEKLEEEGLAIDVEEEEKEVDVMGIVMEHNGEVGGDE
ncbi:hypothetical protein H5410_013531 [Solanum commersonii]|uniref:Uncharacterized protein n=1 Tax=Solanum commersonii TaxID=4109 RepID=A0A9J5ZNK8_SOLCO|nr:hypothetical protein H5410_013531 [Solanum commersonii]